MRSERFVSFSKLRKSPFVFKSRNIRQHLTNWMKWNERWSFKQRKFTFKWSFHRLPRRTSNSLYTSEKPYLEFWEEGFNFHSSFSSSKVALFVSFTFSSSGIKFSIINVLRKRKRKSSALYSPSAFLLAKSLQLILETRAPYRFLDTSMLTGKWYIGWAQCVSGSYPRATRGRRRERSATHLSAFSQTAPLATQKRAWVQANWFSPRAISILSLKINIQLCSVR